MEQVVVAPAARVVVWQLMTEATPVPPVEKVSVTVTLLRGTLPAFFTVNV